MGSFPKTYNDPPEYSHALLSQKLRERYVVPFPDCFRGGEGAAVYRIHESRDHSR